MNSSLDSTPKSIPDGCCKRSLNVPKNKKTKKLLKYKNIDHVTYFFFMDRTIYL